ncbi:MAG: ribonuclease P protein component [Atopococcus tabaci]|uniref:Ribonuclease P protein component n=1 Tax=Atopococcus tabaci TaxID=269774 RepID=A0AA43UCL7_9LACT|nr:ribonuclease P protein component [Atopococcus tabaci]
MRKEYRVKSEREFQDVFNSGKSMANKQFVIYTLTKPGQDHFRVGISVSKKMGNAVKRNKIKRLIRSSIQELSSSLKNDVDFIIIARQPTSTMNYQEVLSSLKHVLSLSHLFINKS